MPGRRGAIGVLVVAIVAGAIRVAVPRPPPPPAPPPAQGAPHFGGRAPGGTPGQAPPGRPPPRRLRDAAQVAQALQANAGVDPTVTAAALAPHPGRRPDAFVPVVTLPTDAYAKARPALAPVPGILFRRTTGRVTPSPGWAAHLLGRVG